MITSLLLPAPPCSPCSSLLLLQVTLRNLTTEEEFVFTYEDWLSRTLGHKHTLVCEMAAVVDGEEMVELTEYIINVKTSDVSGRSHPHRTGQTYRTAPTGQLLQDSSYRTAPRHTGQLLQDSSYTYRTAPI